MIERKEYLDQLELWKDKQIIKLITGIRRSGESTLIEQFQRKLRNSGIAKEQIISINFEDMQFEKLLDYQNLYYNIQDRIMEDMKMYIFLDEVQKVDQYENVVDSLFLHDSIDVYITRSNSYLFSGQLATNLRGRYLELFILPLSFKEYYDDKGGDRSRVFASYMKTGGFPYLLNIDDSTEQLTMSIEGIYHTVLLKDIEERINRKQTANRNSSFTDVALLKAISSYLASVVGSPTSMRGITNYLISNERKVSPNTVSDDITSLCESYLYYPVEPMDISGKEVLNSNKKYYIVDLGFSIENIVYFELHRRGYEIYVGKNKSLEVDFIARKHNEYMYVQVTASMMEESTFEREMKPLREIKDNYKKIVLTLDEFTTGDYEGIKVINVIDWLLVS